MLSRSTAMLNFDRRDSFFPPVTPPVTPLPVVCAHARVSERASVRACVLCSNYQPYAEFGGAAVKGESERE